MASSCCRIQEVYRQTGDSDTAVQRGLASTGRLITSAAGILLAVTIPFAFAEVEGVRQLGIGITAAVFIDVTLIRLGACPVFDETDGEMELVASWPVTIQAVKVQEDEGEAHKLV